MDVQLFIAMLVNSKGKKKFELASSYLQYINFNNCPVAEKTMLNMTFRRVKITALKHGWYPNWKECFKDDDNGSVTDQEITPTLSKSVDAKDLSHATGLSIDQLKEYMGSDGDTVNIDFTDLSDIMQIPINQVKE